MAPIARHGTVDEARAIASHECSEDMIMATSVQREEDTISDLSLRTIVKATIVQRILYSFLSIYLIEQSKE